MRYASPKMVVSALLASIALVVAACGSSNSSSSSSSSSSGSSGGGKKIALLLPESKTTRYEAQDRPLFTAKLKQLCPDCQLLYSNADQDAAKQQQQAEAAMTQGANVLVVDPVDAASASAIVARAKQSKIPVVSYDRLVTNAPVDYYISFDNFKVGALQATALTQKLKADGKQGSVVMINGAQTDSNGKLFKKGAHSVIDKSGFKVAKEYDTPDWSPDKAQTEMEQAITGLGKQGFVGVYAANDGTAGGAISAMKGNGVNPKQVPTTGQDAELAAIQRIINGEQYMTVYKAFKPEAQTAATLAVALAQGKQPPAGLVNAKVNNGQKDVPSVLLKPIAVTKDNVAKTIIKDGLYKAGQLCAGQLAQACTAAGIQ